MTTVTEAITKEHVEDLVRDKEPEGRDLDYKRDLPPTRTEGERKEFLKDVSSFANAAGGLILFGVEEERDSENRKTGRPADVVGLRDVSCDAEILRLEQIIRSGLDPRPSPFPRFKVIDGFAGGPVLALRIYRSWSRPHMLRTDDSRFWSRSSAGKHPLDVREIRSAFVDSEERLDRIRRFREDRVATILADQGPFPLIPNGKVVLHVVPLSAMEEENRFSPAELMEHAKGTGPFYNANVSTRFNFDGHLRYHLEEGLCEAYTQFFRSGAIEGVATSLLETGNTEPPAIASEVFEELTIEALNDFLEVLRRMQAEPPVFVMLTLLGVKGLTVWGQRAYLRRVHLIDRDVLLLPAILVDDLNADPAHTLREAFDMVWQAAGYGFCANYDEHGNWRAKT